MNLGTTQKPRKNLENNFKAKKEKIHRIAKFKKLIALHDLYQLREIHRWEI